MAQPLNLSISDNINKLSDSLKVGLTNPVSKATYSYKLIPALNITVEELHMQLEILGAEGYLLVSTVNHGHEVCLVFAKQN